MRGIPLRCPYHLYTKKNKSVSGFSCLQTYYTRRYTVKESKLIQNRGMDTKTGSHSEPI